MTKGNKILLVVAIFIIGGLLWYGNVKQEDTSLIAEDAQEQASNSVSIKVDDGEKEVENFPEVDFTEGSSALDVTRSVLDMTTSGEGENAFVTAIGDRQARDSENEFWAFMVNGESAEVGAGSYIVKDGDIISWEIDTY